LGILFSNFAPLNHETKYTPDPPSCESAVELVRARGIYCRVEFIFGNSEFLQPLTNFFWEMLLGWIESGAPAISKYSVVDGLDLERVEKGLYSTEMESP
jgi:hypothetical protein